MVQFGIPELPERIIVETCLIGRNEASARNLKVLELGLASKAKRRSSVGGAKLPTSGLFNDAEVNTESANPLRDRHIQTELIKTNSIEIQCNIEEDLKEIEFANQLKTCALNSQDQEQTKQRFIEYVKNKTKQYENGKLECKICGEIKRNPKLIACHMAIHYGPRSLCYRCGLDFEHARLAKNHNCASIRGNKRKYIKCPYHACGVSAISPAELYDHLNEHCGLRPHRCNCCRKKFATLPELRFHRQLSKKCRTSLINNIYKLPKEDLVYRKRVAIVRTTAGRRVLVKFLLSYISRRSNKFSNCCSICLKRCKSVPLCQNHIKRCLNQHRQRLKAKRVENTTATINGINGFISKPE